MRHVPIIPVLLFVASACFAQETFTLSGYVTCDQSGEVLIGTAVYLNESGTGTITNQFGFYSLTLPAGKYAVSYSYLGYQNYSESITLDGDQHRDVELQPVSTQLDEVVVYSEAANRNITEATMGNAKIYPGETRVLPVILGEQDLLKTIQLLPGISSGGEASSGIHVRGGAADQNLIILDGAPVYTSSHLFGFFSVFNSDAIKDMELYKGNIPAEYGGRLSSVLDIQMNDGNSKRFSTSGGIGLLSSRLTLEAPIIKDRGSIIVSGRRTYADLFLIFARDPTIRNTKLFFYDFNAKANYKINDKNRVFLSGYFGKDILRLADIFDFKWGNQTGTFRWNHVFSNQLFMNSAVIYSNYVYGMGYGVSGNLVEIGSGIEDINFKLDFQYFLGAGNTLKFGVNTIRHTFSPGEIKSENEEYFSSQFQAETHSIESAAHLSYRMKMNNWLNANIGVRYSSFISLGPDTLYTYNDEDEPVGMDTYARGEVSANYGFLEPRITFNFMLNRSNSLKVSYARNTQCIHLLSSSSVSLPTDLWIPSSKLVKPQIADQVALGYYRNFHENMFEASLEFYYKHYQNQIDYQDGAEFLMNKDIESQLVFGIGRSYGTELFIKKKTGRLTGWIGYTLSRSERSIDEINKGAWYAVKYDRTHDLSIVTVYQVNEKWNISANWVYNTGNAMTFPSGKYVIEDNMVPAYTERNGYRMPHYHRLDIGATYTPKKRKRFESSLSFSIYNVYGRKNAYSIRFVPNETNPAQTEAVKLSLFQAIPSITYNFKF